MVRGRISRRKWITACGGTAVALTGCLTDSDSSDPAENENESDTDTTSGEDIGADALPADVWPMHNVDPQRTGHHPTTTGPKTRELERYVIFHTERKDGNDTIPAIAGNRMYLVTDSGMIRAINKYNGEVQWTNELTDLDYFPRGPIIYDENVYVTRDESVVAFDAETGDELWRESPNGIDLRIKSVTPGEETFYIFGSFELHEMDPETGETQVLNASVSPKGTYPATDGERIYGVNATKGNIYAYDLETGEELWKRPHGSIYPTVSDGIVVSGKYAYEAETGNEIWSYDGGCQSNSCSVANGTVFGEYDDMVKALDLETGDVIWETDEINGSGYSPTVADGVVYLMNTFYIYGVDTENGDVVVEHEFRDDMARSVESMSDQVLVSEGRVYAYSSTTGRVSVFEEPNNDAQM